MLNIGLLNISSSLILLEIGLLGLDLGMGLDFGLDLIGGGGGGSFFLGGGLNFGVKIGIGIGVVIGGFILIVILFIFWYYNWKNCWFVFGVVGIEEGGEKLKKVFVFVLFFCVFEVDFNFVLEVDGKVVIWFWSMRSEFEGNNIVVVVVGKKVLMVNGN